MHPPTVILKQFKLLEVNSDIEAAMSTGDRPLHMACRDSFVDIVRVLERTSASINALTDRAGAPLGLASSGGHHEVALALLKASGSIDAADNAGDTGLHNAATAGHVAAVSALLQARAQVDAINNQQESSMVLQLKDMPGSCSHRGNRPGRQDCGLRDGAGPAPGRGPRV